MAIPAAPRTGSSIVPAEPVEVKTMGPSTLVVRAPKRLDDAGARAVATAALAAVDDGVQELVLDLTRVNAHAWPAVYALCDLEARLEEHTCDTVAAATNPALLRDLRAVGLDRCWAIQPTVQAALAEVLLRPLGIAS